MHWCILVEFLRCAFFFSAKEKEVLVISSGAQVALSPCIARFCEEEPVSLCSTSRGDIKAVSSSSA